MRGGEDTHGWPPLVSWGEAERYGIGLVAYEGLSNS